MKERILPDHWRHRPETWDWNIFDSVCVHNEYALPNPLPPASLVVDIGAHIGSFSWACHTLGAAAVVAVEMHPENVALLRDNLAPLPRCQVRPAAAWHHFDRPTLHAAPFPGPNTGGCGVFAADGPAVPVLPIGELLADACAWSGLARVRLVKLDCEGSEYPILQGADLSCVDALCGELHDGVEWAARRWTGLDAVALIQRAGFNVRVETAALGLWKFWADKPSFYA